MKKSNTPNQTTQNSKLKTQNFITPAEDFWSRRANAQTEIFEFAPFGMKTIISANQAGVLQAAKLSAKRFSQSDEASDRPASIKIIVLSTPVGPVPADLPEQLTYSGLDAWLTLSAGPWGHAFANLDTREAVLVLSSALAAETRLVSRYFLDHYLLNFILIDWAMLHASCLLSVDRQRLIVMIAPHNTGKSTTALHLLRAGYIFLADGMALLRQDAAGFSVGGYPIGEVKLRDDVLGMFPEYSGQSVQVREHQKTVVDLRTAHPDNIIETVVRPSTLQLCFVERADTVQSTVAELPPAEAPALLAENTIFWDEPARLINNNLTLQSLIRVAKIYHLTIGNNVSNIIATINKLA